MEGLCPCGHEPTGSIVPVSQIQSTFQTSVSKLKHCILLQSLRSCCSFKHESPIVQQSPRTSPSVILAIWTLSQSLQANFVSGQSYCFSVGSNGSLVQAFLPVSIVSFVQFLVFHNIARHAIEYPAALDDLWRSMFKVCQIFNLQEPSLRHASNISHLQSTPGEKFILFVSWRLTRVAGSLRPSTGQPQQSQPSDRNPRELHRPSSIPISLEKSVSLSQVNFICQLSTNQSSWQTQAVK